MSQYNTGIKAFTSGEALETRTRVKMSSATVVYADAGEDFIGVTEHACASGDVVSVKLKNVSGTFKVQAAGAFSSETVLYGAADGLVDDTESGSAQFYSLEAATAAGDVVECMPWNVTAGMGSIDLDSGYNLTVGTFNSTTQGYGSPLSHTNSGDVRFYADDVGTAFASGSVPDVKVALGRMLVTVSQATNPVRIYGLMGQVKSYANGTGKIAEWDNEQVAGTYGYLELVRNAGTVVFDGYGISAGVLGCVENSGAMTCGTNHVIAGLAAVSKLTSDMTQTGSTAGVYVDIYDTTNWSDSTARSVWKYGLLIADSCSTNGIGIGACTTSISLTGAFTTGISIAADGTTALSVTSAFSGTTMISLAGTAADAILISGACSDNGIEITGACTDSAIQVVTGGFGTGLKLDADGTTAIDITANFTGTTGLLLAGTSTNGISITGASATAAISLSGAEAIGLSINTSTPTDGINIAAACANAIAISGANTVSGISISGDQVVGYLFASTAAADAAYRATIPTGITLGAGLDINATSTGTVTSGLTMQGTGTFTTGITLSATAITTGIAISAGSMTDAVKISGATPVDGIEISSACSGYALNLSGASAKSLYSTATTQACEMLVTALPANARGARFAFTCATPAMSDGYGAFEIDLTVSDVATGLTAAASTWVNVPATGTIPASS